MKSIGFNNKISMKEKSPDNVGEKEVTETKKMHWVPVGRPNSSPGTSGLS